VKTLARKKPEQSSGGGNSPWLATFADLMNLLLCFFVMLFAMSEISEEKFNDISISMSNSFSIFDGGGSALDNGDLISTGISQLNELDEYFSNMGQDDAETDSSDSPGGSLEKPEVDEALEVLEKTRSEVSGKMYDEISDLKDKKNLGDYVELDIDSDYRFVQLSLKGSVLFDSGKADIKEVAKPILSSIGDILKLYEGNVIEIVGHTDNVPMTSGAFKDNNWLSSARALNAAEYLIKNKGLDPAKIKYSGRGEYEPVASNATVEGRSKNRRIEIKIYNEYSSK